MKKAEELNLKVRQARLLTRRELNEYEESMPNIGMQYCWWLADEDPEDPSYIAYAERNYTEDEMYCSKYEANTFLRVALDLENASDAGLEPGDKFVFKGYVFTVLSESLAISNSFAGTTVRTKNYDYDDDVTEASLIIGSLFDK